MWNKLFYWFSNSLIDRLVTERVNINTKKYRNLLRDQNKKHLRIQAKLLNEVEVEKNNLKNLQSKLNVEIDRCRETEDLYAYKILMMSKISDTIKSISKLSENFHILHSELDEAVNLLESSSDKQDVANKMFKTSKIIQMKRKN